MRSREISFFSIWKILEYVNSDEINPFNEVFTDWGEREWEKNLSLWQSKKGDGVYSINGRTPFSTKRVISILITLKTWEKKEKMDEAADTSVDLVVRRRRYSWLAKRFFILSEVSQDNQLRAKGEEMMQKFKKKVKYVILC